MTNSPDRAWEQALQDSCGPFQVAWRRPYARGIGYIRGRATQGIGVHDIHTNAGSIHKQRQSVDWADDPHCFLVLQQRGGCHMNLQAQRLELQPGSLVLMDPAGGCSIEPAGLIQHLSITLDRQLVTQTRTALLRPPLHRKHHRPGTTEMGTTARHPRAQRLRTGRRPCYPGVAHRPADPVPEGRYDGYEGRRAAGRTHTPTPCRIPGQRVHPAPRALPGLHRPATQCFPAQPLSRL
ncbi:hypothetical protein [Metapseudomonas otitidis]|uniref:AraC-like ligand-binding domain-containing protein n=1 Tax=Metapseudomonas otitidis TaxID=319939 RepID=UPI00352870A6